MKKFLTSETPPSERHEAPEQDSAAAEQLRKATAAAAWPSGVAMVALAVRGIGAGPAGADAPSTEPPKKDDRAR